MNLASIRLRNFFDHDLSPAPVIGIFLGFWLPLEFSLISTSLGVEKWEKVAIFATSAIFNFGVTSVIFVLFIYLFAIIIRPLGYPFRKRVRHGISMLVWMTVLASIFFFIKDIAFHHHVISHKIKLLLIIAIWLMAFVFYWKCPDPRIVFVFPICVGLGLIPLATLAIIFMACMPHRGLARTQRIYAGDHPQPDILLITLDTLSARHLTMYGGQRPTSPNLQAFSNNAITFDHFYANGNWTRPGVASLLNGVRPWEHGGDFQTPDQKVVDKVSLVSQLVQAGYDATCVVTAFNEASPFAQNISGLFSATRVVSSGSLQFSALVEYLPFLSRGVDFGPIARLRGLLSNSSLAHDKTQAPVAAAKALFSRETHNPRFMWLHFLTTHAPYSTAAPFRFAYRPPYIPPEGDADSPTYGFACGNDLRFPRVYEERYDEAIRCLDDGLGQVFDWLKTKGRYDSTLIVITADHGESFSHGYGGHGGPLLSEDLIWIPCLIKPPWQHGNIRESRLFEQVDLAPTILQMLGLPIPVGLEGYPMAQKPSGRPVFSMNHDLQNHHPTFSVAVRLGDWKYVEHFGTWTYPWPKHELYNIGTDPGETVNLVETQPKCAGDLRALILMELTKHHFSAAVP